MLKKFLGMTWEEAIAEATRQGREVYECEATEWEDAHLEVSTIEGNGAALWFEDDKVVEFEFLGWL